MPIIDGVIRNPSRRRYYGLDVNDRVKQTIQLSGLESYHKYGIVKELSRGDNNRVYVLWDGDKEPSPTVAEWCKFIDENGIEINTVVWRVMQNFHTHDSKRIMSDERFKYVINGLNVTEQQVIKIFNDYPEINIKKDGDYWELIFDYND